MQSYLKYVAIFFGAIAAAPFLAGFVSTFSFGLTLFLLILGFPALALTLVIGTVVWLIDGIKRARQTSERGEQLIAVAASPVLCALTVFLAWPMLAFGSWLGDFAQLGINWNRYQGIVEDLRAGREAEPSEQGEVVYYVDEGPPLRVAFNPQGILDNWSGIVFDPTGEVMKADGFDASGTFRAPQQITKLFGGDLLYCRHLLGDYYSCSFA